MTVAGHKISKKLLITVVIVLIVAITGIIVCSVETPKKMCIGDIYDGLSLKHICIGSEDADLSKLNGVEKSIAKASKVFIVGMSLTDQNTGIAELKVTFPDTSEALEKASESAPKTNLAEFQAYILEHYDTKSAYGVFCNVNLQVNIFCEKGVWRIVTDKELVGAITGNAESKIKAMF